MMLTGLTSTAIGSIRIWRKRVRYLPVCTTAVLFGWLGMRFWKTYLPAQADDVASLYRGVGETVATVQRAAGDLLPLEERVCRTAQAVLPSVVAVRNPFEKPLEVGRHQKNYASGVIITADGIVLSQWHVSHWKASEDGDGTVIRWGSSPTGSAGDRTTVILHDGRECPAEMLGANCTHDVSLLRLLEPGPYPHVPIGATAPVEVGDWVLKIGHPLGYRKDRSAPVRLGRVICGTEEIFGTDYMWCGGDSGGPTFSLDGQLLGINGGGGGSLARMGLPDASFTRVRWRLSVTTGSKLIDSLLDEMRRGEVSPYDGEESARIDRELFTRACLQVADYSQGSASLDRYRPIVQPTRSSVVVVLNAGVGVGLGTVVGAEGWVVTKASELPGQPTCRLPDGKVVSARVAGVDLAFDLALLSVPATGLKPVRWADDFNPPVGTLLAAVGTAEQPLAVGVVSVARRDLDAPVRPSDTLPLRIAPGRPQIFGGPQPISGYSLRAALGLPRATVYHVGNVFGLAYSAGVREADLLYSVNGRRILAEADMLEAVHDGLTGDVVPVRLERAGKLMDLQLPLAPQSLPDTNYRADDFPHGDRVRRAVLFVRVRKSHCRSHRARHRDHDRQGRSARRHGHPRRLHSEAIAGVAEWPISRKLGAASFPWQLACSR
jgi:S1-C subfamily serine protease